MSVRDILSDSYYIMGKELLELTRNRMMLVLMVMMPLLMMIMFGFIYPNNTDMPQNLPVAIVDLSRSGDSAAFLGQLRNLSDQSVKMDFHTVESVGDAGQTERRYTGPSSSPKAEGRRPGKDG
jgi:ABC-2 type transport system permease protein